MFSAIDRLGARLRALFRKQALDDDFSEELAFHVEALTEDNVRKGMTPKEARKRALIALGGVEQTREMHRTVRSVPWIENTSMDLRLGLRQLVKLPGFSAIVIAALAIGIGACATIFSVVRATMWEPLPVGDPGRLFALWENNPERDIERFSVSYPNFKDYREAASAFAGMAATRGTSATLALDGFPERLEAMEVSPGIVDVVGWRLVDGREFLPEESEIGASKVVMVSERLWRNRLGGSETAVGQRIEVNGESREIVGVFGEETYVFGGEIPIWFPLAFREGRDTRDNHDLFVLARLDDGMSSAQAQVELDGIAERLRAAYPDSNDGWGAHLQPVAEVFAPKELRAGMMILFGAVGTLLLIACANVSNLLLTRFSLREREISVRMALGAKRSRVARQLLVESSVYCAMGGVIGALLSFWGVAIVRALVPDDLPRADAIAVDGYGLLFAFLVCGVSLALSGVLPALRGVRNGGAAVLGSGGRVVGLKPSKGRTRSALVVVQLALSLILVVSAGLLTKSYWQLQRVDVGFESEGALAFRITPDPIAYGSGERRSRLYEEMGRRIGALPGVSGVGVSSAVPFGPGRTSLNVYSVDPSAIEPDDSVQAAWRIVSPEYFDTLGIPLLEGRNFTRFDTANAEPTMLISESLAERFWPSGRAVGKRLNPGGGERYYTVVGVVEDSYLMSLSRDSNPSMYFSIWNWWGWETMSVVVRVEGDAMALIPSIREVMRELDPDQPVFDFKPLDGYLRDQYKLPRLNSWLIGAFAAAALFLAAIGVYGVMSSVVSQRANEIGIRVALGADRREIFRMVARQGAGMLAIGLGVGGLIAWQLSRVLQPHLFGDAGGTATILLLACGVLFGGTAVAVIRPLRRAAHIEPMEALRAE